jgi:hypothetical protein
MKFRNLISLIFMTFCLSCVNNKTNEKKETGLILKADTITKFDPEKYTEETKDTILDTEINFRVVIKKTTRMDKYISQIIDIDSTHFNKFNYRDNSINVKVLVDNALKFDTTLVKENLEAIGDDDFLSKSILYNIWIDSYDKAKQTVSMSFSVLVPETDWSYDFSLTVDKEGKHKLLLEQIE